MSKHFYASIDKITSNLFHKLLTPYMNSSTSFAPGAIRELKSNFLINVMTCVYGVCASFRGLFDQITSKVPISIKSWLSVITHMSLSSLPRNETY